MLCRKITVAAGHSLSVSLKSAEQNTSCEACSAVDTMPPLHKAGVAAAHKKQGTKRNDRQRQMWEAKQGQWSLLELPLSNVDLFRWGCWAVSGKAIKQFS